MGLNEHKVRIILEREGKESVPPKWLKAVPPQWLTKAKVGGTQSTQTMEVQRSPVPPAVHDAVAGHSAAGSPQKPPLKKWD